MSSTSAAIHYLLIEEHESQTSLLVLPTTRSDRFTGSFVEMLAADECTDHSVVLVSFIKFIVPKVRTQF